MILNHILSMAWFDNGHHYIRASSPEEAKEYTRKIFVENDEFRIDSMDYFDNIEKVSDKDDESVIKSKLKDGASGSRTDSNFLAVMPEEDEEDHKVRAIEARSNQAGFKGFYTLFWEI